jgi:hypothetical protein
MKTPQTKIIGTSDYSQFKLHDKNRRVNYKKAEKLAVAIKAHNLLPIFPIVVDKNMIILDGQHRFEAAKLAKAKLYYVITSGEYAIENVAETNNMQNHWRTEDFINYYAKEGRAPFVKLVDLARKYKLRSSVIADLALPYKGIEKLKDGSFQFENYDLTKDLLQHAKVIGIEYAFPYWNSRPFLRALRHILNVKNYNKLRMGQRIQANRKLLVKCYDPQQYIKLMEEIYNTGALENVRFL